LIKAESERHHSGAALFYRPIRQPATGDREALLHGLSSRPLPFQLYLKSLDPDEDRVSQLQHSAQDMDGGGNFGGAAFVDAKTRAIAVPLVVDYCRVVSQEAECLVGAEHDV
jgi:hypothetical protein